MPGTRLVLCGNGTDWRTSDKDGGKSDLHTHAVLISKFTHVGTPLREIVRFWQTLPIAIDFWISNDGKGSATPNIPHKGWYHTLTELEHPDRVSSIRVILQDSRL